MVCLIVVMMGILYGLLLYLLKNMELLEAQHNCAEAGVPGPENIPRLDGQVSFRTLPHVFMTDIKLIVVSEGQVVATVSLQNKVVIWIVSSSTHISIDIIDMLLHTASTSSMSPIITSVTVSANGTFCAVGIRAGIIAVWMIIGDSIQSLPHLTLDNSSSGVTVLQFIHQPLGAVSSRHSVQCSDP
jgi:WD40 repeat protein